MTRVLVVAAHPDDETIGASTLLATHHEVTVVHVTDGAPRDRRWRSRAAPESREEYARVRRREAETALALAGIGAGQIRRLDVVDLEASHALPELVTALAGVLEDLRPELVITHAYEGGHPDHDAVAFAVAEARARVDARSDGPLVVEMALYHGVSGELRAGQHLPGLPVLAVPFAPAELVRRAAMLDCFASQRATLAPFRAMACEVFRPAPRYDFACPPHLGPLLYEHWGFPITGAEWRELARRARQSTRPDARRAPRPLGSP